MVLKKHLLISFALLLGISAIAQSHLQKKADNLYNKFSFVDATVAYQELISKNDNTDYAIRQLADSYALMRDPENAVQYYKKAVAQNNISKEYFYNYAQALRGIKDYETSRIWMKRYKDAGGNISENNYLKDADFITAIYGAKPQYFLKNAEFNSEFSDFGAYEKNNKIYFTSSRDQGALIKHVDGWNHEPYLDVYVKDKSSQDFNIDFKSKLKGDVNSIYHDGPLTITKDGKTMYFSRNDFDKDILGKDEAGISNLKIYKAVLVNDKWTNIEKLSINSPSYSIAHPALSHDETKLYFTSNMPDGFGGSDIYYADIYPNGTFGKPQNLGSIVNTNKNESFPFINSEGNLFFSSDGHPGIGLLDIFACISDKDKNIISVLNLGIPVNSNKDDFSFFMNEDGLSGYLTSNRIDGKGSDDIYVFDRIPMLLIEGLITNIETNKPIENAKVVLLNNRGNKITEVSTNEIGRYSINVDRNTNYTVDITKEDFLNDSKQVNTNEINGNTTSITTNFTLKPAIKETKATVVEAITELPTIYYDFDNTNIIKNNTSELDQIVSLMLNETFNLFIEIQSYTDSRGPKAYNSRLSQKRANETYKYLIGKGVDPKRIIKHNGFGEENLTNGCDGTIKCSEEQHQLNRRTKFIVIKI